MKSFHILLFLYFQGLFFFSPRYYLVTQKIMHCIQAEALQKDQTFHFIIFKYFDATMGKKNRGKEAKGHFKLGSRKERDYTLRCYKLLLVKLRNPQNTRDVAIW